MQEHYYLSRREAAEYLTQRGLKFSSNTLMKIATTVTGVRATPAGAIAPSICRPT